MKMPQLSIEQIAEKTLPILFKDIEKNEDYLKKLDKMPMNEETKKEIESVKAEQAEMKASLESINKAMASRKLFEKIDTDDGKFGFKSLGEFIVKQFEADTLKRDGRHDQIDPRIKSLNDYKEKVSNEMIKAGTGPIAGDATYGGILIPPAFGAPMIDQALQDTGLWDQMTTVPMSVPSIEFPTPENWDHSSGYYYGGIYATFTGELSGGTEVRPQWGSIKLSLEAAKLMSAPSNKMILFSPISIETVLKSMMMNALTGLLNDKAINGLGAGEPLGFLSTMGTGGPGLVITRDTAAHIKIGDVLSMDEQFYNRGTGVWIANHNCKKELRLLHQVIGTGGVPIYEYASGNQTVDSLLGRRIIYTEFAQPLGYKGDLILVDPTQYLRGTLSTGAIVNVSECVYFLYDQTGIRIVYYCDARPKWKTYLTPRYATTSYLSPYIAIAT